MLSRKISLFGKVQRGRSPSFELFQLDMYDLEICKILTLLSLGSSVFDKDMSSLQIKLQMLKEITLCITLHAISYHSL